VTNIIHQALNGDLKAIAFIIAQEAAAKPRSVGISNMMPVAELSDA
jgi:hypothetical protein